MIPSPPPADAPLPVAAFDTECYPNYWCLGVLERDSQRVHQFELFEGQRFTPHDIYRISLLFQAFTMVSFNGLGYDVPMICAALYGYTPEQLKWLNDQIIVAGVRPWELPLPGEWKPADHIDIMETAPGKAGLKKYAGIIHTRHMQDLPYAPDQRLGLPEAMEVKRYNVNDLVNTLHLFGELGPQIRQREALGKRYGLDLRSKSDAQVAEAVLRRRCEQATGQRIYKPNVDYNMTFAYKVPHFIAYQLPQLQQALEYVRQSTFRLGPAGNVLMPPALEGLSITIGVSTYKLGIGGLHSSESSRAWRSAADHIIRDSDVASYYPRLMLNSGEYPPALGPAFPVEYEGIVDERLADKALAKTLEKAGDTSSQRYEDAKTGDAGGKIMINGTFGKTGSAYSVLFAPSMLIQTTITGQLSLLMLIEWLELNGIPVISANTDGIVTRTPRHLIDAADWLIAKWQKRTGLEMETVEYAAIYSRDVNNYIAVKTDGKVKRKGAYSNAGLVEKKSPDCDICGDAVAAFLSKGTPLAATIQACRDIRKFVTVRQVNGGAVKLWGEGPDKDARVKDMEPRLVAYGYVKVGRGWQKGPGPILKPREAYEQTFRPQHREYLGKVVRFYYSTIAPGTIVYASNGNTVSLSEGARPCMTLPDEFPDDVDYAWYVRTAESMLSDCGYYSLT